MSPDLSVDAFRDLPVKPRPESRQPLAECHGSRMRMGAIRMPPRGLRPSARRTTRQRGCSRAPGKRIVKTVLTSAYRKGSILPLGPPAYLRRSMSLPPVSALMERSS
jgi:hypothetical protein